MTQHSLDDAYATAIAIIGMSGRFPGARTVEAYWNTIVGGERAIRFFSDEELLAAGVTPEELAQPGYVKAGAVIDEIEQFDASFFGYTPREAEVMDPQQRIFLEVAWEALESAGYDAHTYQGLVGVFAGSAISTYLLNNIFPQPEIVNLLGPLQTSLGNDKDSLATRVSYKLHLRGPSVAVQTYCSTSLVAVHLACQSLLSYECDMVLAGGVALAVPQICGYLYQEGGILSPDGMCRTFDAEAGGSVMGNGAGVVVLKRLAEALEDGDHIYAVIRGSAINNDGHSRVSYTAPGLEGQSGVIIEALANAGVEAESISYIEAHGTATELGDSVELAAMTKAFGLTSEKKQFCALGSVKPNVGHLDRASGVAGLIKTACALYHKQLPPSLNFTRPNPEVDLANGPFYVNTTLTPWPQRAHSPRRAGTSSFGLGGTNVHLILEEAPEGSPGSAARPAHLLLLSARSASALEQMSHNLAQHLREHPDQVLADIAYTLQVGRSIFPHRRALVCTSREEASAQLAQPLSANGGTRHDPTKERRVALLLAGTGEQYADMASDLYTHEPFFREHVDHCLALLARHAGPDLAALLFRGTDRRSTQGGRLDLKALLRPDAQADPREQALRQTRIAQPAIFIIEYALVQLLRHWGIEPQALLGYSLGEYVAACVAGVFSLEDALLLVARRAQWIGEQAAGAMLAVELSADEIQPFVQPPLELAIVSGLQHCVLAGPPQAIAELAEQLQARGIAARPVETTHAFHTSMLAPVQEALTALVRSLQLHTPTIAYISNLTGTWITPQQATDPAYWAEHMCRPVNFLQGIETLVQDTQQVILEIGPGQALSAAVRGYLASRSLPAELVFSTLPSRYERLSDQQALLSTLGRLWLVGVQPSWSAFYDQQQRLRVALPTYPFERQRYWIDPPRPGQSSPAACSAGGKKASSADWFYIPLWKQTSLSTVGQLSDTVGPCLVFLDPTGLGKRLADELRGRGQQVIAVVTHDAFARLDAQTYGLRPSAASDYIALSRELKSRQMFPRTIVHCWSIGQEEPEAGGLQDFQQTQETGFYSLLFFLQALGTQASQPLRIFVLSSHLHAVHGLEHLHPAKATILGLCRVIPQEYIDTTCRTIDLLLPTDGQWDQRLLSALSAEILSTCAQPVVAYRGWTRWVQQYQAERLSDEPEATRCFRQQGVYLITGGLGGIGLYLAEYLATTVQATCVLLTRSPFPEHSEWNAWLAEHSEDDPQSARIRRLQAIAEAGSRVLVLQADVADPQQMRVCIEQIYRHCGTLHGVFHAAGSSAEIGFRAIQDLAAQGCETHFHPKVAGILALQQALEGRSLDFCLAFSSLSAVLGGLGFAAYAAANLFMDAFIYRQRQQATGLPWRCVNWDSWHVKDQIHGVLGATIASYEMTPQEGMTALVRAMSSQQIHLVNSTGDLQARLSQWIQTAAEPEGAQAGQLGTAMARPNLSTPYAPAENEIEERIVEIWEQLLGVAQIGIRDNFFELGGHSLTGTRLISRLRQTFQVNIPLASLFQASTVEDLALIVAELLLEEIEQAQQPLITAHGGSLQ